MAPDSSIAAGDRLVLVDGSNYVFRAFHAMPPLTRRSDKLPVGAVSGFCGMLVRLLGEAGEGEPVTHMAVVFDASGHTFRNDIYEPYKANRPPPEPDLVVQFPLVRDAVRAFNIACVELEGFEADDLIATYATEAEAAGAEVVIHSSDKDLMQLVSDRVTLYDSFRETRVGPVQVEEKFGVGPNLMVDLQALAGDSTDNVPGAPGIGPKTAAALLHEYGNLDAVLARAGEVRQPKRREALTDYAEQIRISRQLVRLTCDAPVPVSLADLRVSEPEPEQLLGFMREMEFRTLTERATKWLNRATPEPDKPVAPAGQAGPEPGLADCRYVTVGDPEALADWVRRAQEAGVVAIDTETDSLDEMQAGLVGVALAVDAGEACYIPIGHVGDGIEAGTLGESALRPGQCTLAEVREALAPLLADDSVLKVGHNLKFDAKILSRHGFRLAPVDDTMLMSYVLGAGAHRHSLDTLAERHFGHSAQSYRDVVGSGRKKKSFAEVELEVATRYAAEDADIALRLHRLLRRALINERKLAVYETLERPLLPVLVEVERAGMRVDPSALNSISAEFDQRARVIESRIHALAGESFNISSPRQLGVILFDRLGHPGGKRASKSGDYRTGADVLETLAAQGSEIAGQVIDWRHLTKLRNTYSEALVEHINPQTGRVHTSFSLAATTTGRLSSMDPNLQNIPMRTEEGRRIREAFVASPGRRLVSLDYNQIELRVLAHIAEIESLREAFRNGVDIHAKTASEIFGVEIEDMDPIVRRRAKAINFGVIYGISRFGLANQLQIPTASAGAFIESYFERFPGIPAYMQRTKELARQHGYVETLFGRRIHTPDINAKGPRKAYQERAAINAPIQGTAADIVRRAMIRVPPALAAAGVEADMILQVHDELLFEAAEADVETVQEVVRAVMEGAAEPAVRLSVPVAVDARSGNNWAEAH